MRHLYLSALFCVFSIFLFGQQTNIDSLKLELRREIHDSIKLNNYSQIVTFYSNKNLPLAEKYLDTLLTLAKIKRLKKYELTGGSQKGILSFRKGEFNQGIDIWKKFLSDKKINNFPIQKGNLLNNIAIGYKVLKNSDSVLHYMHKSIILNEKLKNTEGLIANYYSMSDFYNNININDSSIIYLNKLQKIALESNNRIALARAYILLANISRKEKDFEDAIFQFNKALKIYNEVEKENVVMKRGLKFEIMNTNIRAKNYKTAIKQFTNLKEEYYNGEYDAFWTIADVYLLACYNKTGNFKDGLSIYKKLINSEKTQSIKTNLILLINVSEYELTTNTQNKKTYKRLESALKIATNKKDNEIKQQVLKLLSDYWFKTNNYKNAYSDLIESNKLLDLLNNDAVLNTNLSLKRKFNEELKEKENLQLKAEKAEQAELLAKESKRKWQFGGGLATALIGLGVFTFYYRRNKKQKTVIENLQKELHHRVKNNLAIIDTFIEVVKDEFDDQAIGLKLTELQNRIDSINKVHKQLYTSDNVTNLNLKKYINSLANNVQQSFNVEHVIIDQSIDETLNISPEKSFPIGLIINEFVTNSYKYAFSENKGKIGVKIEEIGNKISLSLSDNGKGLSEDFSVANASTFGIRIMKLLTDQLNGSFNLINDNGVKLHVEFPK